MFISLAWRELDLALVVLACADGNIRCEMIKRFRTKSARDYGGNNAGKQGPNQLRPNAKPISASLAPQENSATNAVPNTRLAKSKVLREIR